MTSLTLEQVVKEVNDLPPLPTVATRIFHMLRDPRVTAKTISDQISMDQGLTAKVLQLANSAFYSYARRVSTISEAVVILGMNTIRNLVLTASVQPTLMREVEGYFLERGALWEHSIATAIGANLLARKVDASLADNAFVAGLLHDMGKLVLNLHMKETYAQVLATVNQEQVPFMVAEEAILGFNHAQVGGRVAEHWNLPLDLTEAIEFHHHPLQAVKHARLAGIIHITDTVAMMMGFGLGGDGLMYPMEGKVFEMFGLDQAAIEDLAGEMVSVVQAMDAL